MMMLRDLSGLRGLGAFGDSCPPGTSDDGTGNCVGTISCPTGYAWSTSNMACTCIDTSCMGQGAASAPAPGPSTSCDAGQVWVNFYQSCVNTCPSGLVYNASGICSSPNVGGGGGGSTPVSPANSAGGSTNQTVVGLIAAVGAKLVGGGATPGAISIAAPTPWYSTPIGLLLIVGGIAGVYFMTKSPGPTSSTVVVK